MLLSELKPGQEARIVSLSVKDADRRRMTDLGFIPGTPIRCEFDAPFKDPTAYSVRGTVIALRRDQAELIEVEAE